MNSEYPMKRRQFLTTATTGGMILVAGCGGSEGNSNGTPVITTVDGPARYARVSLSGPSKVTIDESFRLTLDATNVGSESGSINMNVEVTEGKSSLSRTFSRNLVASGESVTLRTNPIRFTAADTYTFTIAESNVTHTVTVGPKTGTLGTSFKLTDTLRATIQDIAFQPAIFYSPRTASEDKARLLAAPSKHLLAVIRVSLENIGTQSASVDPNSFQLANDNGQMYSSLNRTPLSAAQIKGKPVTALQLAPGEQREGWVLGQVPRSTAHSEIMISYQRDSTGTPAEIRWSAPPKQGNRALPQFSLKSFKLPTTSTVGQDIDATLTVSNEGTKAGTFRGMIEYRSKNSGDWTASQAVSSPIKPGKTARQTVTVTSTSDGPVSYRLAPFETTQTVEYIPPTFAFGESYTTAQNVKVTVSDLQATKSIRLSAGGEPTQRSPPSGKRFVLVRVQSAVVGQSEGTPFSTEFLLKAGSQTFKNATGMTNPLVAPVEGAPYGGVYDPESGETYSWYVVWIVPQQIPLSDLIVQWKSTKTSTGANGETARWTKGGRAPSR